MLKFHILIYGCQMNYADSARLKTVMQNCGFEYVSIEDEADIIIFDSCSVRQKSEDKVTGRMNKIAKTKKIWITGCMVQHEILNIGTKVKYKKGNFNNLVSSTDPVLVGLEDNVDDKIYENRNEKENLLLINHAFNPMYKKLNASFPNLELFFRIDDIAYLPLILENIGYEIKTNDVISNDYCQIVPEFANQLFMPNIKTAYVPISVGCNQFCSYCIVPFARGLERYRSVEDVLDEINHFVEKGSQEILLIGQIVNKHPQFVEILKKAVKIQGIKWLRYVSPYPTYYNEEIFKMHESEEKLCPHIHLPIQSGSDEILRKMNRGYNVAKIKEFIDKVKSLDRDISISTDFIIGFPDESDDDFDLTIELAEYARFDMIYMGMYSPRPGTYANEKYEDNVPANVKKQRWSELNELLGNLSSENNRKEIKKIKDVVITDIAKNEFSGYDEKMKNVLVKSKLTSTDISIGDFAKVEIIGGGMLKLFGRLLEEEDEGTKFL